MNFSLMEWVERAAEWCCWCPRGLCRYSKPSGEMPRNHRAQSGLACLATSGPVVHAPSGQLGGGGAWIWYSLTRGWTTRRPAPALTRPSALRHASRTCGRELLEACEREGEPAHTCYEMDVELESPHAGEEQGSEKLRLGSHQDLQAPRYPRKSSVSTMFRALKCIEGEELAQEDVAIDAP
ncbi:uncharacterized protein LOC135091239 [Scylla paramamosain]|uniref:uncharacterized protein LOC135091239 n=1 Tax=Scylla paramamosain TaxID=85552 RepID=UPI0030832036